MLPRGARGSRAGAKYKLDMSMMFAIHRRAAPRTRAGHAHREGARRRPRPAIASRTGLGTVQEVPDRPPPDRLALADALEGEHAVIEPLLTAIDAAAADPDYGYQRLGDITDELAVKLTAHLAHEETDGLALIDASLTPQQWQHFAHTHGGRLGGDASMYMPWLLNGASPQTLDAVLGNFPPPLLAAVRAVQVPAAGEPARHHVHVRRIHGVVLRADDQGGHLDRGQLGGPLPVGQAGVGADAQLATRLELPGWHYASVVPAAQHEFVLRGPA
jgi:hypothetical protein